MIRRSYRFEPVGFEPGDSNQWFSPVPPSAGFWCYLLFVTIFCRNEFETGPHLKGQGASELDSLPLELLMMKTPMDYSDLTHDGPELTEEDQVCKSCTVFNRALWLSW